MALVFRVFAGIALLISQARATESNANPMQKVLELLDMLQKGLEKEGKEDIEIYEEYKISHRNEMEKGEAIVKENKEKAEQLKSDLKEAEAFRDGKNMELVETANKIAKNSAELTAATEGRKKDRALFEKNEATFIESLDQLDRALSTLAKKEPAASAASASASLLSVAENLKNTLVHGSDFTLSTSQRETLDSFMRQAAAAAGGPSFLQTASNGPYGEYKSNSGGLVGTLEELKVKVGKERTAATGEEQKQQNEFKTFESGLKQSLENDKKSLSDIKSSIAQSQEQSSQKQATLLEAEEILKVETAHLEQIDGVFRVKTWAYKIRLGKRSDEAIAVHEANRILNTEIAKTFINKQSIGTMDPASSFLQLSMEKASVTKRALHLLRKATRPGLSFLSMKRSHSHKNHRSRSDPFAKVKTMIKGMLEKLNEKQAGESKHAAWCDKEMGSTTKNQKRKEEDVQKMNDRIDSLEADLEQTNAEIVTATKDLQGINETMTSANKIRLKEHAVAVTSIKTYKNGAALLTRGMNVLKGYYENKAGGGSEVNKKEFKDRHGLGSGIIGILEIAVDDFKQLYTETKEAEEAAEKDFNEMHGESEVRQATFEKDLEWKSKRKVKLEFDQTTMNNDLKSYEKELTAINTYMEQLKASCIVKGPTYSEKKAKREAELGSLKEALTALSS